MVAILIGLSLPAILVLVRDVEYWLLLLYVLSLCLRIDFHMVYEKLPSGGIRGLGISLRDLTMFALYVLWLARVMTQPSERRPIRWVPSLSIPLALLFLWSALSITQAVDPLMSFYELIRILETLLAFFYLANNVHRDKQWQGIVVALSLAVLIQAVLGFSQYFFGMTFNLKIFGETRSSLLIQEIGESPMARVGGTLGHPNGLGNFLGSILPILGAAIFAPLPFRIRGLALTSFMAGLGTLVLTFSRGSWMSFVVVMPVVFLVGGWKRWGFGGALRRWILVGAIAVACLAPFSGMIAQRLFEDDGGRGYSRVPLMQVAGNIIRAHPVLGAGLDNYTLVMRDYDNTLERITLHVPNPVHNMYLYLAAEIGVPGLLFLGWFLFELFRIGLSIFRKEQGYRSWLALGVTAGLASYLIHGLVSYSQILSPAYVPFFAGSLVALRRKETVQDG